MVIKLKEDYVPKSITVPRKVPYARRDEEIKEIRKMEADSIIEQVGDRHTEFCSPTICPIKPDGSLRFATDFTYLNKQVISKQVTSKQGTSKQITSQVQKERVPVSVLRSGNNEKQPQTG